MVLSGVEASVFKHSTSISMKKCSAALLFALSSVIPLSQLYAQGGDGRLGEMVKRMDVNADGKISKDEAINAGKAEAEGRFTQMDANADGVADESEMKAVAEKMRERGGERRGGPENGFRKPAEGAQSPGFPGGAAGSPGLGGFPGGPGAMMGMRGMLGGNPLEAIKAADANNDKALDLTEYLAMRNKEAEDTFKRLDGNADGKISEEEFRQVAERMRGMMGGRGGPGAAGSPGMMRRPGGEAAGGFRRPPAQEAKPEPKPEGEKPAEPAPAK
jgi:Ca2+-binding EF-hand superfamily protein